MVEGAGYFAYEGAQVGPGMFFIFVDTAEHCKNQR